MMMMMMMIYIYSKLEVLILSGDLNSTHPIQSSTVSFI